MRFGLRAVEPPALGRIHLGTLAGEAVDELARELDRVGVGEHVPLPHDAPHPRQLHAEGLEPTPAPLFETLLTIGNLLPRGSGVLIGMAGVLPVAVGEEDGWHLLAFLQAQRPVEVAGDKQPRRAFKGNVGDGVAAGPFISLGIGTLFNRAVDRRIERRLLRHRPQPLRNQDPLAHLRGPRLPGVERGGRGERERTIEILERSEAHLVGMGCRGKQDGMDCRGKRDGQKDQEDGAAAGGGWAGHGEQTSWGNGAARSPPEK